MIRQFIQTGHHAFDMGLKNIFFIEKHLTFSYFKYLKATEKKQHQTVQFLSTFQIMDSQLFHLEKQFQYLVDQLNLSPEEKVIYEDVYQSALQQQQKKQ